MGIWAYGHMGIWETDDAAVIISGAACTSSMKTSASRANAASKE